MGELRMVRVASAQGMPWIVRVKEKDADSPEASAVAVTVTV